MARFQFLVEIAMELGFFEIRDRSIFNKFLANRQQGGAGDGCTRSTQVDSSPGWNSEERVVLASGSTANGWSALSTQGQKHLISIMVHLSGCSALSGIPFGVSNFVFF
jgi:hypothetical protein